METMTRDNWTDARLDDLSHRMDQSFQQVRADMDQGFNRVDSDIRELRSEMTSRFDSLQRTLILGAAGVIAALIGVIATQL
jgi:hypothetical protein